MHKSVQFVGLQLDGTILYAASMADKLTVVVGRNIRRIRDAAEISIQTLADMAGSHKNTVMGIENGNAENTTVETIEKIAKALNTTVPALMFDETMPKPPGLIDFLNGPRGRMASLEDVLVLHQIACSTAPGGGADAGFYHVVYDALQLAKAGKKP